MVLAARENLKDKMLKRLLIACLLVVLCGCTGLLPKGSSDTPVRFENFEQAKAAAERIVGRQTTVEELKALGFDPVTRPNVTLIPYPEIVAKLAPYPGVPVEQLDSGIQQCIREQSACRGYQFHFERQDRKREGNFLLDFLNFKRDTYITGWWFDALIVVSDGLVLFRNYGGQAATDRVEKQSKPLGPLQPAGEAAGVYLLH
jgi:hypothetical protein